ncbi:helix-turn-helix transcriptional regulator [Nocardioides aquaticus]|uniref:helix-turn-helix transcriptional regulator n=2 Tax=Actinomycetes TaxID=1760 RepID=UPI001BD260B3|nr:helix-turn-helix domain-containing protein [Nocardioides aquaticus]
MARDDEGEQLPLWGEEENSDLGTRTPYPVATPATAVGAAQRPDKTARPSPTTDVEDRPDPDGLWDIDAVATYLNVPRQTIYAWRQKGYGPHGFRVGKHLRWRAATVVAWTVERERLQ